MPHVFREATREAFAKRIFPFRFHSSGVDIFNRRTAQNDG